MEILVDTREQPTDRALKRYERFGCPYRRATLSYGDYCYNALLPDGMIIHSTYDTIHPLCAVERKMDLDELAACFTRGRARFVGEFDRARENGGRLYLLVENATWENLLNGRYRTKVAVNAFKASVVAFMVRYQTSIVFCKEESSGEIIREVLYRDLKERLERGEFDEHG